MKGPESFEVPETGVAVHGQGFATRAVTDDLAARYPAPQRGAFNIGLLHTSRGRTRRARALRAVPRRDARRQGYDYWALGHVHKREVLAATRGWCFPATCKGGTRARPGAKGATLVTVDDGAHRSVEHRALDVVRWTLVEVDASGAASGHDVVDSSKDAIASALADADGSPSPRAFASSARTPRTDALARARAVRERNPRRRPRISPTTRFASRTSSSTRIRRSISPRSAPATTPSDSSPEASMP